MKILTQKYLQEYLKNIWEVDFLKLENKLGNFEFDYLIEASSVYSSNIEWNSIDLNSFMNAKMNKTKTKDIKEIDSLIKAYNFAKDNVLNEINLLYTHNLSSQTILIKSKRWKYRNEKVWVFWKNWLIYLRVESEFVETKMKDLFDDITYLLKKDLSIEEVFYYASLIHLVFVHIHPFSDWNGRTARLLEKWFLASKLWNNFWKISSEEYYYKNRQIYYQNINLWVNFYELNYDLSLNFLLMLIKSVI